jgi:hypothetical protein
MSVGKPEGETIGKPRHRQEDNIRIDPKDIECEGVNRMHLAHHKDQWRALVNTVINLGVPYKAGNFFTSRVNIGFSRRTLLHGVCYNFALIFKASYISCNFLYRYE